MKVIIAAAGTGGHINPGIAIANKIKQENKNSEIIFIGTTRGLENDLVPRAGYKLKTINAHGFSKKISIEAIKDNIDTIRGIGQAKKIIKEFKPDIVIGTGGYICGPVFVAARRCNIPTIIHESNAFPGTAVKLLSKKADSTLLGFAEAKEKLPKAKKIVITGTPTKIKKLNLTEQEKENIKKQTGLKLDLPIVLVFGGSQGAKAINDSLLEIIYNKLNEEYQIMWAAGPKQYDIIKQELESKRININNIKNVKIVPYIYNMEEIMNISDMLVCRSGAMTITEAAIVGKPAIFIPLPNVSQNHQEYNAKVLEKIGAAKIILNKDLNAQILSKTIKEIVLNKEKLEQMGKLARTKALENAEDKIYNEIEVIIQSHNNKY